MTIEETYKKYRHLDQLLSDRERLPASFLGFIIFDLWQAVKEETVKTKVQEAHHETVPRNGG
ncbi:MAG: hypothetical protein V2A79_10195 [Planctomycetota bacterium]